MSGSKPEALPSSADTRREEMVARAKGRSDELWRGVSYSSVGIEMAVATVLGLGGGGYIDYKFETSPTFTMVGFFFGIAAGFYGLWKATLRAKRDAAASNVHSTDPSEEPSLG